MLDVFTAEVRNVFHPAVKKVSVNFVGTPAEVVQLLGKLERAAYWDGSLKEQINFNKVSRVKQELERK